MAEPFLAEIRIFSCNFAPKGWALCNGQLLPINQNQALFSLLGTTYGGDGRVNFALPDLRGRLPIGYGEGFVLGQRGGEYAHTLTISELPSHTHVLNASTNIANSSSPVEKTWATTPLSVYQDGALANTVLHPGVVTNVGGSQAHLNMQPSITLNFCIALQGIFPSQT